MGLTVHYSLKTPAKWSQADIRAKLELAPLFAKALPVVSVSDLVVFTGHEADFQYIRDAGLEEQDEFFWAKIQAQRHMLNPWLPGEPVRQSPNHMMVFKVIPAEGCEEMNVGCCSYSRHIWRIDRDHDSVPCWSLVFEEENAYPDSRKVMRQFMRRWKLRRLARPTENERRGSRFGEMQKPICRIANGAAEAAIYKGRAGAVGILVIHDRMQQEVDLKFQGSAEEAEKAFSSEEFRIDLERMVFGEDHVVAPAKGQWGAFCVTQYANDPRCGGWENFVKAHLSVLAILEHFQKLGFHVEVTDEGDFWEKRDLKALANSIGRYDALVARMMGAMKDAAREQGQRVESAMDGRPDFERLEMKGQETLAELLKRITARKNRLRRPPSGST